VIDLINAFFSSIDKAADFINDVWKVLLFFFFITLEPRVE